MWARGRASGMDVSMDGAGASSLGGAGRPVGWCRDGRRGWVRVRARGFALQDGTPGAVALGSAECG